MDIPVYLVAGFLDSGKTNFINGVLEDGFARQDKTLLLRCEEGEEAYNPRALDNVIVVDIGDEADLTCSRMKELEKKQEVYKAAVETVDSKQRELEEAEGQADGGAEMELSP